jgi:hypothetical protein
MALTIAIVNRNVSGAQKQVIADVTFDNSYPTGGEAFAPSDVDPGESSSSAFHFVVIGMNDVTLADQREVDYDYTNKKLMVKTAITTEATNASDQSAVKVRVMGFYGQVTG